jgi:flagellar biogenesis protein FliO
MFTLMVILLLLILAAIWLVAHAGRNQGRVEQEHVEPRR